eukprot:4848720-Amphidinium_carterae.1
MVRVEELSVLWHSLRYISSPPRSFLMMLLFSWLRTKVQEVSEQETSSACSFFPVQHNDGSCKSVKSL